VAEGLHHPHILLTLLVRVHLQLHQPYHQIVFCLFELILLYRLHLFAVEEDHLAVAVFFLILALALPALAGSRLVELLGGEESDPEDIDGFCLQAKAL